MPSAMLKACSWPGGCANLVESGRCADHPDESARDSDRWRGSAHERGYTASWRTFRLRFARMLIQVGIAPICGAALPGGPAMLESRCKAERRVNNRDLHLHHDPPLTAAERRSKRAVEDPLRVGFLCGRCHNAATARAMGRPAA